MLSFRQTCEINKQRIKPTQKQETFCKTSYKLIKTFYIHKITTNSPKFNNIENWRATVNGELSKL